jgi:hypothetical protein
MSDSRGSADPRSFTPPSKSRHWFSFDFWDELFSLPPPDLVCYAYAMVNRQDVPYSPGSPEIGRGLLPAEIIFDGTKLALEGSRPKTTTNGINCSFRPHSISQKNTTIAVRRIQARVHAAIPDE